MTKKNITIVSGGWSREREISLKSGEFCSKILNDVGFNVKNVILDNNLDLFIEQLSSTELVFNATHGVFGEDGSLQALLDNLEIPYTHSGSVASNLAFNKHLCSSVLKRHGLPSPRHMLTTPDNLAHSLKNIEQDVVVKPTNEGSSLEVYLLNSEAKRNEFCRNIPTSLTKYHTIMIEDFIHGREITISVLDGKPIGVTEIIAQGEFYDFKNKYSENLSEHICPAKLDKDIYNLSLDMATRAFNIVGCKGLARIDIRFNPQLEQEGLFILEINTQPGMTEISLAPEQAVTYGWTIHEFLSKIVQSALT